MGRGGYKGASLGHLQSSSSKHTLTSWPHRGLGASFAELDVLKYLSSMGFPGSFFLTTLAPPCGQSRPPPAAGHTRGHRSQPEQVGSLGMGPAAGWPGFHTDPPTQLPARRQPNLLECAYTRASKGHGLIPNLSPFMMDSCPLAPGPLLPA